LANGTAPSSPSQNSVEPRDLLRILGAAFSALSFLWFFSKLHTPSEDAREPVDKEHTPEPKRLRSQTRLGGPQVVHASDYSNDNGERKTPFWEKAAVILALVLMVVNFFQTLATGKAAQAAKDSADWTKDQALNVFNGQRPQVWVKVPERFEVEIGKPLGAKLEVFNYGNAPTLARARIYIETSPTALERFRNNPHPLNHPMTEVKGTREILLAPHQGTTEFPIEPKRILTEADYQLITIGTFDVVIYGRIDFPNLRAPTTEQYTSSFCFYRMSDGTVSGCPDYGKYHHTNFMPW
jgi:hypothetical protein